MWAFHMWTGSQGARELPGMGARNRTLSLYLCVGVYTSPGCTCVHHVHAQHRGGQTTVSDSLELEFRWLWAALGCWESNLGPLQEQVLLTTEPSAQTLFKTKRSNLFILLRVLYLFWSYSPLLQLFPGLFPNFVSFLKNKTKLCCPVILGVWPFPGAWLTYIELSSSPSCKQ